MTSALFEADLVERQLLEDPRIAMLMWWAKRFAELGFTPSYGPGDHGNMSCRTPQGLVITARETVKATLEPRQFVEVIGIDWQSPPWAEPHRPITLTCRGLLWPSTDSLMHLRIYALRPDVHAILHGHDNAALARAESLRLPVTATSATTSSMELIDEVCRIAATSDYLLLRDHGFLALGKSLDAAGELARTVNTRARS